MENLQPRVWETSLYPCCNGGWSMPEEEVYGLWGCSTPRPLKPLTQFSEICEGHLCLTYIYNPLIVNTGNVLYHFRPQTDLCSWANRGLLAFWNGRLVSGNVILSLASLDELLRIFPFVIACLAFSCKGEELNYTSLKWSMFFQYLWWVVS